MNEEESLKKDKASLCRIKVNKMISSVNSYKDIFIPKYTLTNRNETKYLSDINKPRKGYSSKASSKKINNIKKMNYQNNTYRITTKYNYIKQPIDFIINHGVLVYQRNFNGDEVINYGINNEYLRKNKLNMIKNNSSIYQTKYNFAQTENNNMYSKYNKFGLSHKKKSMNNSNSKKRLISISDIPSSKAKKNISIIQNKINNKNLKLNQNSINNINSISIKNLLGSSNKKTLTDKNTSSGLNTKKILINYKRKKNTNNKYFIIKKKNLNSILGNEEESILNNKNTSKKNPNLNNPNNIIPKLNKKSYTIHLKSKLKKEDKNKNKNENTNNKIFIKNNANIEKLEIKKKFLEKISKFYLKKYFNLFRNKIKDNKRREKERGKRLNTNKIILENNRLNKKIQNSFDFPNQKSSKSNSLNRKLSSSSLISKDIYKNKNKNKNNNLSFLISKNLRFFSTEKEDRKSELCRDSKSLQKKYEQIYNRKRREMSMTFSNRIKNDSVSAFENNYLSDINKTNSFSNINDNNSTNSVIIGKNQKKFKQIFYKDNNNNLNNSDNRKDKNIYKIKLIKGNNNKQKKIISYRIEKASEENNQKEKYNLKNLSEIKHINSKTTNSNSSNDVDINNKNSINYSNKKFSFNINTDNIINDFKLNRKIRKMNELKDKNNVRIKEIYSKNIKEKNILNDINKNKSKSKNKIKNKIIVHIIKNICTKDKRIFINIKYFPLVLKSRNIIKYNYKILKIKKIMNYNYTGIKKSKNLFKRNGEIEKKLSLIREEDERSKFQNSNNSIKYMDEDRLYSSKKININIRMLNKKNYKLYLTKMINILQKLYFNYYINDKKDFIKRLKVIYFIIQIKNIINNKIKDTNVYKLLKQKRKRMIYYPKSEKYKIGNKVRNISNIYIEDKVYLNNIIINDKNFFTSNSFDFKREFKIFESPDIRPKIYYRNNVIDFNNNSEIHQILSKTENKKFNKNL